LERGLLMRPEAAAANVETTMTASPVIAYGRASRIVVAILVAVSRCSLPAILGLLIFSTEFDLTPPKLVRLVLFYSLLPGVVAAVLKRAYSGVVEWQAGSLIFRRRRVRLALDVESLASSPAWRVPLPGPGLSMRTRDDRWVHLQADDLARLLRMTGAAANAPESSPALAFAQARHGAVVIGRSRWLLKYGLFPALPTLIFFRLHQYIMFGGPLGQYYLEGLRPYLSTLAFHWIMALVYLVLYASGWRGAAETVSFVAAALSPRHALIVRQWAERAVSIAYYAGVPVLIGVRFLA
jgi:hypothetical protein